MQADPQCNDNINWIRIRERVPQDHKKEMKVRKTEAHTHTRIFFSNNPRSMTVNT